MLSRAFLGPSSAHRSESRFLLAFLLLPHPALVSLLHEECLLAPSLILLKSKGSCLGKVINVLDVFFLGLSPCCLLPCNCLSGLP